MPEKGRGIHVQDIAHFIDYDLLEAAEHLIHRVGRTGRAGGRGIASTLFAEDERWELRRLEHTLGIRMERMQANTGLAENNVSGVSEACLRNGHGNQRERVNRRAFNIAV